MVEQLSLTYFYWFALGMALAVLSVAWQDRQRPPRVVRLVSDRPATCWAIALGVYLVLGAALTSAPQHIHFSDAQLIVQHILRGVVALFLILPAVFGDTAGGWPRRVLSLRWLGWLGLVSYGIYLGISRSSLSSRVGWPTPVAAARERDPVSMACAAASYYVVERPILRFKDLRPRGRKAKDGEQVARVTA